MMWLARRMAPAVLGLLLLVGAPALAQVPGVPTAPAPPPPSADTEIQAIVKALENPATRDALIRRLKEAEAAPPPAPEAAITGVIGELQAEVGARVTATTQSVVSLADSIQAVPTLVYWLRAQLGDPAVRGLWIGISLQIWSAILAGWLVSLLTRRLLRGWRVRHSDLPPMPALPAKLRAAAAHLTVDFAALATFLAVAFGALQVLEVSWLARRVAIDLVAGVAIVRPIMAVIKAVLAIHHPRQRLLPISDVEARSLKRWIGAILGLSIYGYVVLQSGLRVGLPWSVHSFELRLLYAVVTILIVLLILRQRPQLEAAIEHWGATAKADFAHRVPWRTVAVVGHIVLAAFVIVHYLVWALAIPGGTVLLTRGFLVTLMVLAVQRVLLILIERRWPPPAAQASSDGVAMEEEPAPTRAPGLLPLALRVLVFVLSVATIAQGWGFDIIGWLRSDGGAALLGAVVRLAAVLAVALALGQLVNLIARRYLERRDGAGNLVHSNRSRTLASILRNFALVALAFIAVVNILAEVGVDATALLAGAGVVGLAVGFGAQTLVKDLITGLFILLGDTIRVGDVVDLGGRSGGVEAMSMRTIALRAYDGSVITIPYSSIDVVTNLTKDFGFAVIEIGVGYNEDLDRVVEVMRELDVKLRREWPFRRIILEPLDVAGLERFEHSAVVVKARIKTRAGEQWKVGYEYKRRLKKRFAELGIEIPYPHMQLMLPERAAAVEEAALSAPDPRLARGA